MVNLLENGANVVLLGLMPKTAAIIKALNRDFSITPCLFAERRPFHILPTIKYNFVHCLIPQNKYYSLHSVLDMVSAPHEVRTILVPCTSQFEKYISEYKDYFEIEYIIRNLSQLTEALPSVQLLVKSLPHGGLKYDL